ncbi:MULTISPECIES: gluconate 2-dehydrogenase subunit 3 family protein [unclassified Pseudomonas]|uniref:gluconate 2-dehydrogenase subunit 3 family protein n=1 Tax=unclassified Pseudomonas TaxID=196821 RepID=UPI001C44965F|nr:MULTISPECIES: gluconate 2-dehydrogenase subunit 3 family protein [unclassified Pseudomonas]MBV7480068.1 gluconate 2-dehydrogenase subunit 3 family protein [Pseudomonas sp. PDM31]MDN4543303.1 gluconate 2-dehydrogenase subunit 3 family protein [Pseudomonas sp. C32]
MLRRHFLANTCALLGGITASGLVNALAGSDKQSLTFPLNSHQAQLCSVLSDIVIPRTDTPGAVDANVPNFIESVVSDWYTHRERTIFLDGLTELDEYCLNKFGTSFLNSSSAQQLACLQDAETVAQAYTKAHPQPVTPATLMGKGAIDQEAPFFTKLKELVVVGYYTSEAASNTEMQYLPVPGRYDGEATLQANGGRQYIW